MMEFANTLKSNSNMSDTVCKFCALKSIGVLPSQVPNLRHFHKSICVGASPSEDRNVANKVIEMATGEGSCSGEEIMKIFDTVSALKSAYLQLQQAHIPYDPQKIITSYQGVDAELEKLCKFKHAYKEKRYRKTKSYSKASCFDLLQSEIGRKEAFFRKLNSLNSVKDSQILRLQQELQDLEMGNKNLRKMIKRISQKREASVLSAAKFEDFFKAAAKSIHDFSKPLISLIKASGWDLDMAAKCIENAAVYSKGCDKKYAFEAYIARRMFHGVSLTSYDVSDIVKFDDPIDALMENPNSDFSKFCGTKYLLVVHPTMEESFFGNLDHRTLILGGKHPRTEFYQLFAKVAKWVWVLLGSAVSIDANATMFSVNRESMFSGLYMESVEEEGKNAVLSDLERASYKVQFMVMPGFKVAEALVKSRVYISKTCLKLNGGSFNW
ncbi:Protein GRAVITROPIC IN THE LIGHT 1 [Vigna angularis]|uniref:Protein GRAVITROPIC IN THE LIGHT 1 n=4 Tax=Phaseolus angularis TaxID=3914 RepID=A0A8T0K8X6_PHAAN|nr:Protein GRAVITROPIC IN THE LIGHT 1 [Vigna angularis]